MNPMVNKFGIDGTARLAGLLGLIPFAFALGCVMTDTHYGLGDLGERIALAWGAVILAFIAAVHWGLALAGRWPWSVAVIIGSTTPSVLGALGVLIGGERGIALLVAGFGAFWLYETRWHADDLPANYLALRRILSMGVCALLALTAFAGAGEVG